MVGTFNFRLGELHLSGRLIISKVLQLPTIKAFLHHVQPESLVTVRSWYDRVLYTLHIYGTYTPSPWSRPCSRLRPCPKSDCPNEFTDPLRMQVRERERVHVAPLLVIMKKGPGGRGPSLRSGNGSTEPAQKYKILYALRPSVLEICFRDLLLSPFFPTHNTRLSNLTPPYQPLPPPSPPN